MGSWDSRWNKFTNAQCTDESRGYERSRSRSPQRERRGDEADRARSASPNDRDRMDSRYVLNLQGPMLNRC